MSTEQEIRSLVCELCRQFYQLGWVTGTGGSISIRDGENIYMTPSGVQKERIKPEELFIVNKAGDVVRAPSPKAKLSDCAPLFLHAYNQRDAGAVLHSHGDCCNLVTLLFEGKPEFRITKQEMIKGIEGHGYYDELVVPIIENTAWEHELADSLGEAIAKYPKAVAVLVRHHGMYVWGKTWEQAKRHAECLHYLFESTIKTYQLGLSHLITKDTGKRTATEAGLITSCLAKKAANFPFKHLVLDIEGTLAPITFVKDVLFPYAFENASAYLTKAWANDNIKSLVQDLYTQYLQDKTQNIDSTLPVFSSPDSIVDVVKYVQWNITKDRKLTPLKTLQGLIWKEGYESGSLLSDIYEDVPPVLQALSQAGVKISIYSSGSRQAQHLLFRYSNCGDLRQFLTAYFDTKVGYKQESTSYSEIALSLGVDSPSDILFVTDVLGEAKAAAAAGLSAVIAKRVGNAEITEAHNFKVITSFEQL